MGGSKVFAQKVPSSGEAFCYHIKLRSNRKAACCSVLGRRFQSRSANCGRRRRRAMFAQPGFEPPTKKFAVGCITIRPKLALKTLVLPTPYCLDPSLPLTKKPKLCVSV